jgi:hypothetical protein
MKKYSIICALMISSVICYAQNYFTVDTTFNKIDTVYKISLLGNDDSMLRSKEYPIFWNKSVHFPNIDTTKILEELLKFEGDERICSVKIITYSGYLCNPHLYLKSEKKYSLQVEALFIINQLLFNESCVFSYVSNPVLKERASKKYESIKGEIINRTYQAYKEWFKKAKIEGYSTLLQNHIYPLRDTGITWY